MSPVQEDQCLQCRRRDALAWCLSAASFRMQGGFREGSPILSQAASRSLSSARGRRRKQQGLANHSREQRTRRSISAARAAKAEVIPKGREDKTVLRFRATKCEEVACALRASRSN